MKNHIYRIDLADDSKFELYVCETNEVEPYRETLEMGLVVIKTSTSMQLDASLDLDELDSLIEYLRDCQRYISEFNKNSKPKEV